MEQFTLAGLLFIVLTTAVREVFGWFKQKNLQNSEARLKSLEGSIGGLKDSNEKLKESNDKLKDELLEPLKTKIDTLYEWHDKTDQDGVKVWYVRKSLEDSLSDTSKAMNILAKNSEIQTKLLEEMNNEQRAFRSEQMVLAKLVDSIAANKNNNQ